MTDAINFRALCVNLLDCLEKADWPPRNRHVFEQWVYIARAALAEPVAEPPAVAEQPSDEEWNHASWDDLAELFYRHCCEVGDEGVGIVAEDVPAFARAVLARWGRPAQPAPPAEGEVAELVNYLRGIKSLHCQRAAELLERHAAPVPVPVAERLPQPEDCDADGKCWLWNAPQFLGEAGWWTLNHYAWSEDPTHWLPAHALPLPAPQGGEVE